jgi:hypothetical protein
MIQKVRRRKSGNSRRGAATVEMALIAPVILALIFGSIEFGRMMMVRQALTNAAREACRHACLVSTFTASESVDVAQEALRGVIYKKPGVEVVMATVEPAFTSPPESGTSIVMKIEVDCSEVSWLPPVFYSGAKIQVMSSMLRE